MQIEAGFRTFGAELKVILWLRSSATFPTWKLLTPGYETLWCSAEQP